MLRKLAELKIKLKKKKAQFISKKRFDEYGFTFLGLYKPKYFDDYLYTHTRAVFYTKESDNNLISYVKNAKLIEKSNIVTMKVGSSFIKYAMYKKYNNIVDLITDAIEYNKYGKQTTIKKILLATPSCIYATEAATDKIIDSIMEYPELLEFFSKVKEEKLKLIEKNTQQTETIQNQ